MTDTPKDPQIAEYKQSKTRVARIERAMPRILEGFGVHD